MADLCIHLLHRCVLCHTDLLPRGRRKPARTPGRFVAKHVTACDGCGFDIEKGDIAGWRKGRPVHADRRGCDR